MMVTLCLRIPKDYNQKPQMKQGPKKEIKKDIQGPTNNTQEN
jgi:hypothetical protein